MRTITLLLSMFVLAVGLAACGNDDDGESEGSGAQADAAMEKKDDAAMEKKDDAAMEKKDDAAMEKAGTTITLAGSEFGEMLFDSKKQAIYVFENDGENETNCFGECAAEWPPVFTKGEPKAGSGVDAELLGTIERDGRKQVTYAGKPLYFYAHEDPGQVLCHNVDLNGGLWWVVGADGEPRPA